MRAQDLLKNAALLDDDEIQSEGNQKGKKKPRPDDHLRERLIALNIAKEIVAPERNSEIKWLSCCSFFTLCFLGSGIYLWVRSQQLKDEPGGLNDQYDSLMSQYSTTISSTNPNKTCNDVLSLDNYSDFSDAWSNPSYKNLSQTCITILRHLINIQSAKDLETHFLIGIVNCAIGVICLCVILPRVKAQLCKGSVSNTNPEYTAALQTIHVDPTLSPYAMYNEITTVERNLKSLARQKEELSKISTLFSWGPDIPTIILEYLQCQTQTSSKK